MRSTQIVGLLATLFACLALGPPLGEAQAAAASEAPLVRHGNAAVPGQYIVVFDEGVHDVRGLTNSLLRAHGGNAQHVYRHALKGFSARLSASAVTALRRNRNVDLVEEDRTFTLRDHTVQESAPWGLDRIDQRDLPLSTSYTYSSTGAGVTIYVVDSGIRMTHDEFGGRASLGVDFIDDGRNGGDCLGHGTEVAGVAGGATWGVAKAAKLVSVRVAPCSDTGYESNAVAAVDWITADHETAPAVANLSFGWPIVGEKTAVEIAIENSIEDGVFYAGATDNSRVHACYDFPSRVTPLMTVARTNSSDRMVANTGFGPCIDIFAPGQLIPTASASSDTGTVTHSGTSFATPHVAGVAALHLQQHPSWTPAQVTAQILADATSGRIGTDTNGVPLPDGTPDLLLFSPFMDSPAHLARYASYEGSGVHFDASGLAEPGGGPTFTWSFGDGASGTGATPTYVYADNGVYTVSVTDDSATTLAATTATIANVAPTVDAGASASLSSGEMFELAGTFSDPGIGDAPWAWTINWGNGTTTAGSTNVNSAAVGATRRFCAPGSYTVVLLVTDKDGDTGDDAAVASVAYLAAGIDVKPGESPNRVSISNKGLLPVAVLSTATFDATTVDPATVTLGDELGSDTPAGTRSKGRFYADVEDVNRDGRPDLVLRFSVPALVANDDLTTETASLVMRGTLGDACTSFRGVDAVRVIR